MFEHRQLGGKIGSEDFSETRSGFLAAGGDPVSGFRLGLDFAGAGVIDITGRWIDPPSTSRAFDKDDPSIRLVQRDTLWGLARADGSWLVEPKFQQADPLSDGLARVKVNGKVGFIDRAGNFAIEPVFDQAPGFVPGFAQSSAERDGVVGVIDKSGSWVFQTSYQQIFSATTSGKDRISMLGWKVKNADRWGLLDLDGRVVLDTDFDQAIHYCADGRLEAYKNKEWLYFKTDGTPLQPPDGRLLDASCFGGVPPYTLKIGDSGWSTPTPVL